MKRFIQAVTRTMRRNEEFRSMSPSRGWLSASTTCVRTLRASRAADDQDVVDWLLRSILISVISTIWDLVSTRTVHVMHLDVLPLSIYQRDCNQ